MPKVNEFTNQTLESLTKMQIVKAHNGKNLRIPTICRRCSTRQPRSGWADVYSECDLTSEIEVSIILLCRTCYTAVVEDTSGTEFKPLPLPEIKTGIRSVGSVLSLPVELDQTRARARADRPGQRQRQSA